jgi:hypothetical protein
MAGKVGLSLALARAIGSLASAYVGSKIPLFNIYAAKKEIRSLNQTFAKLQMNSIALHILGSVALLALCYFLLPVLNWSDRLLSVSSLAVLVSSELCMVIISNYAIYLRAFKREPFVWLSIISGCGSMVSIVSGFHFFDSVEVSILLYALLQLGIMFMARSIYLKYKTNNPIGRLAIDTQ